MIGNVLIRGPASQLWDSVKRDFLSSQINRQIQTGGPTRPDLLIIGGHHNKEKVLIGKKYATLEWRNILLWNGEICYTRMEKYDS